MVEGSIVIGFSDMLSIAQTTNDWNSWDYGIDTIFLKKTTTKSIN
jgi:hypothetical protein